MESHSTLVSDIMDEMDPQMLDFIKKHVTTFTRWDLIKFFYENIDTHDTAENLARYIGRATELVEQEADKLVEEKILKALRESDHTVYLLTEDKNTLKIVADLVETSQERTFRMKLVYHILRAGGQE